ncbi:MAG: YggS family pyridoxal phosphate-dependent enzyme [Sphingobacteriales bacterium]|nr:YggS family pyridoxal phosphate-dependent enzyme [Sphingobacteriales bacterium]
MAVNREAYLQLKKELDVEGVTLVAVSKTKPFEEILELYNLGHRDFGENYVQEMAEKAKQLPQDIRWHFIGHLQTNKVKLIVSFVQLIQSVDSLKLLLEINKQAQKVNRVVDCLMQVHIAQEETKFGLDENELIELMKEFESKGMQNVRICGLMGMASFTDDMNKVRKEFQNLKRLFDRLTTHDSRLTTLSMGMTSDYRIAIEDGSNMVRIGSLIFGERN